MKVLVADDERDITDVMARRLEREGYDVSKAYDGDEAWDQIVSEDPDIVLLDINMPQKDGFTLLKLMRRNPPSQKRQAVVMISGRNDIECIRESFDLEADHYLTKPCRMKDVLHAIKLTSRLTLNYQK